MTGKIIGIDLGTTNSAVALVDRGRPRLISVNGDNIMPSVVGVAHTGEMLIGRPARNQWVLAPERTVRSIKRKMGKNETVRMAERDYTPQEISSFILKALKQAAESFLGESVERAVITVPAYFNELQRQATIEAGEIAGLTVERIINEPTASALAYGLGKDEDARVLVYDLGGGTFDVSIIEMSQGIIDVRATAGNNYLGGDDFDEMLASLIADEFAHEHDIDLRAHHQSWSRLLRAAEEAKIALSSAPFTNIDLEFIASDKHNRPLHIRRELARAEFEELIEDKLDETIELVNKALADAELTAADIDRVLLVGGSTRIPRVWQLLSNHLDQEPHIEIDPDAAVALGAAVQAAIIAKEDIDAILVDVTPLSLGVESADISFLGELRTDRFTPLIRRNTTIPVQKSELFSTLYPGQDRIQVKVYQGEDKIASRNVLLGEFFVDDLKANRPDGRTDVVISFQLDINGILDVSVVERKSGLQVRQQLKASRQRLSAGEIAASKQKVSALYGDESPEHAPESGDSVPGEHFDPGTHALLVRAQAAVARPDLAEPLRARINEVIARIHALTAQHDPEQLEQACDELIDLLFDAEE